MPTWLIGAVRAGLQVAWAFVVNWALQRGITLPEDSPAWLDDAVFGLVLAAFVGLVQWMETRDESTLVGRALRRVAKLLMLWQRKADYPKPVEPPADGTVRRDYY